MAGHGVYNKLDDRHIRLLTLSPGSKSAPLQCRVNPVDTREKLEYEAISYLWGDASNREAIQCDSQTLSITGNAAAALRRHRFSDKPRVLWMDQICINQRDLDEKRQQVRLMFSIYSKASSVLMWLGPDPEQLAPIAKDFMTFIGQNYDRPLNTDLRPLDMIKEWELPDTDSVKWKALKTMMALPYFARVWMVQEVRVSKNTAVASWGDTEIPFIVIAFAATWGTENAFTLNTVPGDNLVDAADCATVNQLMWSDVERDLSFLLGKTSYRKCFDERDKIYGLLNLVPPAQRPPRGADYRMTTAEVFRDTVRHLMLTADGNLDLLQDVSLQAAHPLFQGEPWPSWVPRWSDDDRFDKVVKVYVSTHNAADGFPLQQISTSDQGILSVKGLEIDVIKYMVPVGDKAEVPRRPTASEFDEAWRLALASGRYDTSDRPLIEQLLWTMTCGTVIDIRGEKPDAWPEQLYVDFIAFAIMSSVLEDPNKVDFAVMEAAALSVTKMLDIPYDATNPEHASYRVFWKNCAKRVYPDTYRVAYESLKRQLDKRHPGVHVPDQIQRHIVPFMMFAWPELGEGDVGRFRRVYHQAGSGLRFFTTTAGHMGMAPLWAEVGDVVAILYGSKVPVLLRPRDGHYLVVGTCYVYGIMDGEYVRQLRREGVLEQRMRVFDLH